MPRFELSRAPLTEKARQEASNWGLFRSGKHPSGIEETEKKENV